MKQQERARSTSASPGLGAGEPLLHVDELRTYFPAQPAERRHGRDWCRAVDGVSFDLRAGATLGLVGESGCGKTTVARSVLRLVAPTAGRIRFAGVDLLSLSGRRLRAVRRQMQMVFQDPFGSLNPRMTVGQIVAEPLLIHTTLDRRRRRAAVCDLLERVGLRADHVDRYPHEFSGGQRQRIGIARAIAPRPKLIVCDEPVSALDVSIQSQILNLLRDLQRSMGVAYLFISHDLAVVRHVSDRVAVMYLGKIVEVATAGDLYAGPRHPYTMALLAAVPDPEAAGRDLRRRIQQAAPRGDVPSPTDPPPGCAYHARCPYATDLCARERPALVNRAGLNLDHLVACHHADSLEVDTHRPVDAQPT